MPASVCVLTAKGMSAIGSVVLAGDGAPAILEKIFRSKHPHAPSGYPPFAEGESIWHGHIVDGETVIDEVVVACEADNRFVIHCHGNPLLVEQIVKLCQTQGAVPISVEQFTSQLYRTQSANAIEAETKSAMQTCATLSGAKLIANQLTDGLLPTVQKWLDGFDQMTLHELWAACHRVLRKTSRAKYLINRCKIVLVGPPNSGKSTLLNRLAGRDEVIVTDTAGTTRDWVKVTCHIGPLLADIYDTAGLDAALAGQEADSAAQQTTMQLVRSADMNIYVFDVTNEYQAQSLLFSLGSLKGVLAANKCDLLTLRQRENLYGKYVRLCAVSGDGLDGLVQRLLEALKVADFDLRTSVCFTDRQLLFLRQLLKTKDKPTAKKHLQTLIFGNNPV